MLNMTEHAAGIAYTEQFADAPAAWLAAEIARVAESMAADGAANSAYGAGLVAGYALRLAAVVAASA